MTHDGGGYGGGEQGIIIMLRSPDPTDSYKCATLVLVIREYGRLWSVECGVDVINGLTSQIWDAILLNKTKSIGIGVKYSAFLFYD